MTIRRIAPITLSIVSNLLQLRTINCSSSLQHYTNWLPRHNAKEATKMWSYLLGVTAPYFTEVNQAIIGKPEC